MSDTLSSNGFNVGIAPIVPNAPVGSNPLSKGMKYADAKDPSVTREIPGLYQHNVETGEAEQVLDFANRPKKEDKKAKPTKDKAETSNEEKPNRHQEWKAKQQEKKEAREAAKVEKAVKNQALAMDALKKGNMAEAAKLLNTTVPELFTLFQNASLSIPTKEAELSPEEKKAKDEADYRASIENVKKEFDQYKYETTKYQYIKENIEPVFSNKEKYELLNNAKDPNAYKSAAYEYMNQHYVETGEILNIEDVLDTMEEQLSETATAAVQQFKNIKKFSQYFNQAEAAEAERAAKSSKKKPAPQVELDEEEEEQEEVQLGSEDEEDDDRADLPGTNFNIAGTAGDKPFALMTVQEKMAYFKKMKK